MDEPQLFEPPAPTEPEATPAASRWGLWRVAAIVFAALSVILGLVAVNATSAKQNLEDRDTSVRRSAGAFASAFLNYDYRHLDKQKAAVLRLSTGAFKKQFEQGFDAGLAVLLKNAESISQVQDITVYAGDQDSGSATAIVVIATNVSGVAGKNRSLTSYLQMDLVKSGGAWKVDSLTNLNLGLPESNSSSGGSTTPTTASAPTTTR